MASAFPLDPSLGDASLYVNDTAHDDEAALDIATAQAITDSLLAAQESASPGDIDARMSDVLAARMRPHANFGKRKLEDGTVDGAAEKDPPSYFAPYDRPPRDDDTPNPLYFEFSDRARWEGWMEAEDSWCHLVQRRVTTPEKRSMERAKAKEKAQERLIAAMTEDERAAYQEPKKRKRNRTSVVAEKVTFTCHHAGLYESRHSAELPHHKLRLKTKDSVKCNCPCKVVANVMLNGPVLVTYFWRHEGHGESPAARLRDPYAEGEMEEGRLPKVLDDWIVEQLKLGTAPDELRKLLELKEDERQQMISHASAAGEPEPNLPPPIATRHKIKYPDIYNRYRRFHGPIRAGKAPKNPAKRRAKPPIKEDAEAFEVDYDAAASVDAQFEGLAEGLDLSAVAAAAQAAGDSQSRALGDALASLANAGEGDLDEHAQMTENLIRIAMESQMGAEWVERA